jgi:1,2-phenylacetyl-CoA epoxidase catalytic subunit
MNKNLAIVFGMFFVLLMVGIVSAASTQAIKDSYGQCVSQNAVLKNTCFSTTKQTLATCKASVPQDDTKKAALKECRTTYKTQKKQCKTSFKSSKGVCKQARNAQEAMASG